jgi:hypothetical protein
LTIAAGGSNISFRNLTAMRQNMSAKWFGGMMLLIFAAPLLAWPLPAAAQSHVPSIRGIQTGVTILTPTKGVDFNSYTNRLLATVKRNWYAVMPESALFGDKGIVVLTFHIQRDGKIPDADPKLERTSGAKDFDVAAMSAVETSVPFERLPEAFHGPNIQVRFTFFYNAAVPKGLLLQCDCENNPPSDRSEPRLVPLDHPPAFSL